MEKTDLSEMILKDGTEGLTDYVVKTKSEDLAEKIYRRVMVAIIAVLLGCLIFRPEQKTIYVADKAGVKRYTDSLQNFVDTTLKLDFKPTNKQLQ